MGLGADFMHACVEPGADSLGGHVCGCGHRIRAHKRYESCPTMRYEHVFGRGRVGRQTRAVMGASMEWALAALDGAHTAIDTVV
jgi:hypothetical protein